VISTIAAVTETAAREHLDRGEVATARAQAILGLSVEPVSESLATLAQHACLAAEDVQGARRVREALDRELAALDDDPVDEPMADLAWAARAHGRSRSTP
jgi:hypothetical protein